MRRRITFTHWTDQDGTVFEVGTEYNGRSFAEHEADKLRAHVGAKKLTPHYSGG